MFGSFYAGYCSGAVWEKLRKRPDWVECPGLVGIEFAKFDGAKNVRCEQMKEMCWFPHSRF